MPAPISTTERIRVVDVLRGFALFGVLLTNLWGLVMERPDAFVSRSLETLPDKIVDVSVYVFFLNKFITLFSILFGYGFGMIITRIRQKGLQPFGFFTRRMLFIFFLGLIHIGFWWGEILNVYAICGFLLVFFSSVSQRSLLIIAACCIFFTGPIMHLLNILYPATDPEMKDRVFASYMYANRQGSVADIFQANYSVMNQLFFGLWFYLRDVFEIFGKFLIGFYIFRSGVLQQLDQQISRIRSVWKWVLVPALAYGIEKYLYYNGAFSLKNPYGKAVDHLLDNAGVLAVAFFYATTVIRLYFRFPKNVLFKALGAVGTLSLTNYLTHTVFYFFLFTGFGLGLLDHLPVFYILPIAIGIYLFQVGFSMIWNRYFLFGPAEWVWRQWTYRKRLPLLK